MNILSIDQKDNLLLFNQLGIALINKSLFISNPKIKISFHNSNFQKSERHVPTGSVGTPLNGEILFLLENELTFWSWNFIEICTNCHTYTFRKFHWCPKPNFTIPQRFPYENAARFVFIDQDWGLILDTMLWWSSKGVKQKSYFFYVSC